MNRYWQLKKEHFHSSVLGFLPEALHDLAAGQPEDTASQTDQTPNSNSNNMGKPYPPNHHPCFLSLRHADRLSLCLCSAGAGLGRTGVHPLSRGLRQRVVTRVSTLSRK